MGFFRRDSEPSARESFLVAALAAVGFSAENIKDAEDKKATDFLKVLDRSDAVRAELQAAIKGASDERDAALASHSAFVAALEANGFTKDQIISPDALKAATESLIKTKAEERAVEISAARGIKPVSNAPSEASERPEAKRSEFDSWDHEKRNAHIRRGGRVVEG